MFHSIQKTISLLFCTFTFDLSITERETGRCRFVTKSLHLPSVYLSVCFFFLSLDFFVPALLFGSFIHQKWDTNMLAKQTIDCCLVMAQIWTPVFVIGWLFLEQKICFRLHGFFKKYDRCIKRPDDFIMSICFSFLYSGMTNFYK